MEWIMVAVERSMRLSWRDLDRAKARTRLLGGVCVLRAKGTEVIQLKTRMWMDVLC